MICGCHVHQNDDGNFTYWIDFCSLHQAAENMRDTLQAIWHEGVTAGKLKDKVQQALAAAKEPT